MRAAFERWARFALARSRTLLAITMLVTALLAAAAGSWLHADVTTAGLIGRDAPTMRVLESLRETFGHDKVFQIVVEGDVFTPAFVTRLAALDTALGRLELDGEPVVAGVDSLADLDLFGLGPLVDAPDSWLPAFRERVLGEPTYVGHLLDPVGTHAVLVVHTVPMDEPTAARLYDLLAATAPTDPGFHAQVAGMPAMETAINRTMEGDIARMTGGSLVVMALLLTALFRRPRLVAGPLIVVLMSVVWTFGAMACAGAPVTGVTTVLTSFLLCVGVGDAIHLQSAFREARRDGLDHDDAIVRAMGRSGVPVTLTTLTTAAGLLGFTTSSLVSVVHMGVFGAFGMLAALVHSLVFLPCFLSLTRRFDTAPPPVSRALDGVLSRLAGVSQHGAVLAVAAALTLIGSAGATLVGSTYDPVSWIPTEHPVRQALDTLDTHVGGLGSVVVRVDAPEGETLWSVDTLSALTDLETHIAGYRAPDGSTPVTHTGGLLTPARRAWSLLNGGRPPTPLPADQSSLDGVLGFLDDAEAGLDAVVTPDGRTGLLVARVRWMPSNAYLPLARHIERGTDRLEGLARVQLTGSVFAASDIVGTLVHDLIASFGTALLVITLIFGGMMNNLRLTAMAMVSNLLPMVWVAGLMGIAGIPLNLNTVLVASIAIGIAVDDTIHFLWTYQEALPELGPEAAVRATLARVGPAMISTSVVLIAGFLVFLGAEMLNVQRFGALVAAAVTAAAAVDLVVLPALLRVGQPEIYGTQVSSLSA